METSGFSLTRATCFLKERLSRNGALASVLTLVHEHLPLMSRARSFAVQYLKGMPHAAAWRGRIVRCETYGDFMALVDAVEKDMERCEAALASGEALPDILDVDF